MRQYLKLLLCFFVSAFFLSSNIFAVDIPRPTGYVNDFAQIYSADFKQSLEKELSEFEKNTGVEMALVTVKSLEGMDIESYAVNLFEDWKIGKKGQDNGLLLLMSIKDRVVRIEVGYGIEEKVPDGFAGQLIRKEILPKFRNEDYEGGTLAALKMLEERIGSTDISVTAEKDSNNNFPIIPVLIIGYIFFTYFVSFLGRTKEIWPGGAIGGIFGIVLGSFIGSLAGAVVGLFILGLIGLFLDFILSKNFSYRKSRGLPTGFFPSGGGFRSTRQSFGGFGGGRSGGGGASGRW